jgi:PKD repeat protein
VPAGDNLVYKLNNNRWGGTADATGSLKLVVEIPVIDDPEFPIGNVTLVSGLPLTATGSPDLTETLGDVLAENKPPVISAVARDGTFVEGADNTFTALATDNCSSTLSYKWKFSDGGIAFGRIAHHVFADNGTYTAKLTVTDQAGNSAVTDIDDLDPIVITNGNPNVSPPSNKAGAWGDPITYHVDAVDPSPVDQNTLSYRWTFGDGSFADGRDVTHAFAAPGNYSSSVAATDKDGGAGSAGFSTTISKRATTLVYTGPSSSNPSKSVPLSATLTDDHGQPVVGRLVSYAVGTQNASAPTNGAGLSSFALYLTQKPGTYSRSASFAGDTMYLGSSDNGSFLVGKK